MNHNPYSVFVIGTIVENIGCLLNNEDYLSISSLVVGAALKRQLEDGQAIVR